MNFMKIDNNKMNETKLSSDEVPEKFAEWLLSMGCPPEKVPARDKITEICRGQYYLVWRSLMERTHPKDIVRRKRLQVFCDDIHKCQNLNVLNQNNSSLEPEELSVWKQHEQLTAEVETEKAHLTQARHNLDALLNKVGEKVAQRNLISMNVANAQRRAFLLQSLSQELSTKRDNLKETRSIATRLCTFGDDNAGEIKSKLDKYLSSTERTNRLPDQLASLSVASSDGDSFNNETQESQLSQLVQSTGSALCSQLYARRGALLRSLNAHDDTVIQQTSDTPQSVLAHTAALHCNLALEATKNNILFRQTHNQLVHAVTELNNVLTSEECELLVVRCERVRFESRVNTMKILLDELSHLSPAAADRTAGSVAAVDRDIEQKRDELEKVILSLTTIERKINNVKECLNYVFQWLQESAATNRYRGVQLDLPPESMSTLREFYETRREALRQRVELSLQLDASDRSIQGTIENPKYPDELRLYLSNFNLEKNRQLVLESGEKTWTFSTVDAAIQRFHKKWLDDSLSCSLLSPSDSLALSVRSLTDMVDRKAELEAMAARLGVAHNNVENMPIDIRPQVEEEAKIIDIVKKRLKDNLNLTQQVNKTIKTSRDNLTFWSENKLKKYISPHRTVNGLGYKAYETWYLDNFAFQK